MTAFYLVSIIGCFVTLADNHASDCWAKFDSNDAYKLEQLKTEDDNDVFNVNVAVNHLCILGSIVLTIQFFLLLFANKHKCIAWLAALSFFPWIWFFVKVNLVRFAHTGEVCFGDFLPKGIRSQAPEPYLI